MRAHKRSLTNRTHCTKNYMACVYFCAWNIEWYPACVLSLSVSLPSWITCHTKSDRYSNLHGFCLCVYSMNQNRKKIPLKMDTINKRKRTQKWIELIHTKNSNKIQWKLKRTHKRTGEIVNCFFLVLWKGKVRCFVHRNMFLFFGCCVPEPVSQLFYTCM